MPHNLPYYASQSALLCLILCPTMPHTLPYNVTYFLLCPPLPPGTNMPHKLVRPHMILPLLFSASSLALAIWTRCLCCPTELFDRYYICSMVGLLHSLSLHYLFLQKNYLYVTANEIFRPSFHNKIDIFILGIISPRLYSSIP